MKACVPRGRVIHVHHMEACAPGAHLLEKRWSQGSIMAPAPNLQSPAPQADALSIGPRGLLFHHHPDSTIASLQTDFAVHV